MSDNSFYFEFEDRHRGSRKLIKSRLMVYLPFVEPLLSFYPGTLAVDLGCGRGEWLEVLTSVGFRPHGIDSDRRMIRTCLELGLTAEQSEAVEYMATVPDESQAVVSAFHFVEHISFNRLRTLVSEAMRVLKPGGLLIMETPNPENIIVATRHFYVDPTHQRPIPPELLAFIPEHAGFKRTKILRLQDASELPKNPALSLLDVLGGVSPDYAVVAQKEGPAELFDETTPAFNAEYGLTIETLADRYRQQVETRTTQIEAETRTVLEEYRSMQAKAEARALLAESHVREAEARISAAEIRARQAQTRASELEAALESLRKELRNVLQANHHHWLLAEARQHQIHALLNSKAWRITAPIRFLLDRVKTERHGGFGFSLALRRGLAYALNRQGLVNLFHRFLRPFPRLHNYAIRRVDAVMYPQENKVSSAQPLNIAGSASAGNLSHRARQIYADLKAAMELSRKENS